MNRVPTISVVCPTFNSSKFICETLLSVLKQTQTPLELILSDDGSTDNTTEIIQDFLKDVNCPIIKILQNPHRGPGATRNAGIRAAQGEWIAFLDSDDYWYPEKIERLIWTIIQHREINFFCHDVYHCLMNGTREQLHLAQRYQNIPITRQLFRNCPFVTSAVVCKKELLLKHGFFDEKLLSAQDFELWLRLGPFLSVHFIDDALGSYNDRAGNISSKKRWRHFRNVMIALFRNRKNTKFHLYCLGTIRHLVIFLKNQMIVLAKKKY